MKKITLVTLLLLPIVIFGFAQVDPDFYYYQVIQFRGGGPNDNVFYVDPETALGANEQDNWCIVTNNDESNQSFFRLWWSNQDPPTCQSPLDGGHYYRGYNCPAGTYVDDTFDQTTIFPCVPCPDGVNEASCEIECPLGSVRVEATIDEQGNVVPGTCEQICPANSTVNEDTSTQLGFTCTCDAGHDQFTDPDGNVLCPEQCGTAEVRDEFGQCTQDCSAQGAGYDYSAQAGQCVLKCDIGYVNDTPDSCIKWCDYGKTATTAGGCQNNCPVGQTYVDGNCNDSCPSDMVMLPTGSCSQNCPAGTELMSNGACRTTDNGTNPGGEGGNEEGEEEGTFSGPGDITDAGESGSWWTPEYTDGFSGVWNANATDFSQTAIGSWLTSFNFSDTGSCPSWTFDLSPLMSGNATLDPPCYIWDYIRIIMIVTSLFAARKIIIG